MSTTENTPVGADTPRVGDDTAPSQTELVAPSGQPGDGGGSEPQTYDAEYVKTLREEAAASRVRAKRTDEAEAKLHELAIAQATRDLLMAPDDIGWTPDLADEHGWPDHDKIRAAAEELIARKPYLARVRGDVGQGQRGDQEQPVSLSAILRAGA